MTLPQGSDHIDESDIQFRQLADFMPQLVWTARPDGYLDYYNKQWYDYTGFAEGYGDQSWLPILHSNDVQLCVDTWYNSVKTGEAYEIEYRFVDRKKPGLYRWFLGRACPIKDSNGQIIKWFGTCTDIEEQKRESQTLAQLVAERTRELNQANADLQRSNEYLAQFASVASHDLQEPLRKVHMFSRMLLDNHGSVLDERGVDLVVRMQKTVERMSDLMQAILNYSRLSTQKTTFTSVNLNDVVRGVLNDLELMTQQKEALIQVAALPTVIGDATQLRQLFQNLLSNALKFQARDAKPIIQVSAQPVISQVVLPELINTDKAKETPFWEVQVVDNGIGFDQQHSDRLFQMFERLHGRTQYEGTGIGLAISKRIVENHNGLIKAHSKLGEGATFSVYLPSLHP